MGLGDEESSGVNVEDLEGFFSELPDLIGHDIHFEKSERESEEGRKIIHFEVSGEEKESFLGKDGEVLESLTHVAMRVQRKLLGLANSSNEEVEFPRVEFDSDGFREKRREFLRELAAKLKKKVVDARGKPTFLSAMGPAERKVVHTEISSIGEVSSESIGKGYFKRMKIFPSNPKEFREKYGAPIRQEGGRGRNDRNDRNDRNNNRSRNGNNPNRNSGNRDFSKRNEQKEQNGNVFKKEEENFVDDNIGNKAPAGNNRDESFFSND